MGKDIHSGPVVQNPTGNAGDKGLIPDLWRLHMSRGNSAHAPKLLSLHTTAIETCMP